MENHANHMPEHATAVTQASTTEATPPTWTQTLQSAIRDPQTLLQALNLDPVLLNGAQLGHALFPICVPAPFLQRMRVGDRADPLLKQVLPLIDETQFTPGYSADPLQEAQANPIPGILHKYQNRVLLTLSTHCAVNCRFCFRRDFAYADNRVGRQHWPKIWAYLRAHPEVDEVILSGGDPLVLPDALLAEFVQALSELPQIRYLRIHTRLPVMIPARVTAQLCQLLSSTRLRSVVVIHCNHPQEVDAAVQAALSRLYQHHITVLNQCVLLLGVNDQADILAELSHTLFAAHTLPYYCHLLDKVQGTAHFAVPLSEARAIQQALRARLPGYLVPKFVFEEPGAYAKTPFV